MSRGNAEEVPRYSMEDIPEIVSENADLRRRLEEAEKAFQDVGRALKGFADAWERLPESDRQKVRELDAEALGLKEGGR